LERLESYSEINKSVSDGAIQKLSGHLWYLSEEMICLAFFDPMVSLEEKRAMLQAMDEVQGLPNQPKRITLADLAAVRKPSSFVTTQSKAFFTSLGLAGNFLHADPQVWSQDNDYVAALKVVKALKVYKVFKLHCLCLFEGLIFYFVIS
jgi:hypothetical protein